MDTSKISIVEKFISIQGEGRNLGIPYGFVRVGGCPLRCFKCDSSYTFQPGLDSIVDVDDIVLWCLKQHVDWISITGGEPLIYPAQLKHILNRLNLSGYKTHVETSGRYYDRDCHRLSSLWSPDVKTPCTGEQDDKWKEWIDYLRPQDQVKFVIREESDFDYVEPIHELIDGRCPSVFQPFNELVDIEDRKESLIVKRSGLIERTKWITERLLKYKWKNVIITPQLHVLLFGNKAGT